MFAVLPLKAPATAAVDTEITHWVLAGKVKYDVAAGEFHVVAETV